MGQSRFALLAGVPPVTEWPVIDLFCLDERARATAGRRQRAIQMYVDGASHVQIREATGIMRAEVNRLFHRCTAMAGDGRIFGMRALVPGVRIERYRREAGVMCQPGDFNHGCAGALEQLFERFPELRRRIHQAFLQTQPRHKGQEARVRISDLHALMMQWLEKHGLRKTEWPRSTSNEGLEALRRYCMSLLDKEPDQWIRARSGIKAARRLTVGRGIAPVLPMLRPYGAVQLDFHKVDSACVIAIVNPFGCTVQLPLARWHIGVLLEERFELILGAVLALELTPSADSVLETIECALAPIVQGSGRCAIAIGMGDRIFPNQLFSSLEGQCFSILRMDNGWSNTAKDVIDNVIDTIGCAVQFGPVRAWWGRDAIERVFGQLTRGGLQRSPATYGTGPNDTRKGNPNEIAEALEIRLSDLTRALEHAIMGHNASRTAALMMASPNAALQAAMENSASGFIQAPLPPSESPFPLLMYHVEIATVRGSIEKGERPYVKIGGWRYTNPRLADDFGLLGHHLRLYCSRRDVRVVYASVVETGEVLGSLKPPNRWLDVLLDWRSRELLNRGGTIQRRQEQRHIRHEDWLYERGYLTEPLLSLRPPGGRKRALLVAKEALQGLPPEPAASGETRALPPCAEATRDAVGELIALDSKVQIEHIFQGEQS